MQIQECFNGIFTIVDTGKIIVKNAGSAKPQLFGGGSF